MYKRCCLLVFILCTFSLTNVDATCTVDNKFASCDSWDNPQYIYDNVEGIEIRNVSDKALLPQNLLRATKFTAIDIIYCRIPKILAETFVDLPVEYLTLSNNGIEYIQPGAFRNLTVLYSLHLNNNKLKNITAGIYNDLPIRTLTLSRNDIATIEDSSLKGLKQLYCLYLDSNKIESIFIHKIVEFPDQIEIVFLQNNHIRNLTRLMMKRLSNLLELNLGFNRIETIQPRTFELTPKLLSLVLSGNLLREIDANIFPKRGSNIQGLCLNHNQLMFLSSNVFFRLNSMKKVSLVGNPWLCPCLKLISKLLYDNQIREHTTLEFESGEQPVCISDFSINGCEYVYKTKLCERYFEFVNNAPVYDEINAFCPYLSGNER